MGNVVDFGQVGQALEAEILQERFRGPVEKGPAGDFLSPRDFYQASFQQGMPNVAFTACGNTMRNMKKKTGKDVVLMSKIKVVPAGVTRIMDLQEKGWSYLKP